MTSIASKIQAVFGLMTISAISLITTGLNKVCLMSSSNKQISDEVLDTMARRARSLWSS